MTGHSITITRPHVSLAMIVTLLPFLFTTVSAQLLGGYPMGGYAPGGYPLGGYLGSPYGPMRYGAAAPYGPASYDVQVPREEGVPYDGSWKAGMTPTESFHVKDPRQFDDAGSQPYDGSGVDGAGEDRLNARGIGEPNAVGANGGDRVRPEGAEELGIGKDERRDDDEPSQLPTARDTDLEAPSEYDAKLGAGHSTETVQLGPTPVPQEAQAGPGQHQQTSLSSIGFQSFMSNFFATIFGFGATSSAGATPTTIMAPTPAPTSDE